MDIEEEEKPKKKQKVKNLDEMSIEALGEYVAELEAEIARTREKIGEKEGARNSAESVFKK